MLHRCFIWLSLAGFVVLSLWTQPVAAYPWMIRHEYTGCAACHTDPSGGWLLTPYGRAQTQALLSSFGKGPPGDEVDGRSQFAWGVEFPDWLNAGASVRNLYMVAKPSSGPTDTRFVQMQADARMMVASKGFEAAGSLGFVHEGDRLAAVTRSAQNNVVAREFWLGYRFGEDQATVLRGGRLYLPFGVRTIEHTLYVRNQTYTNLDDQQQWGVSLFHQGEKYRAEIMGIAGNYQTRPDDYRRRGYAGYFEYDLGNRFELGLSSELLYTKIDPELVAPSWFGSHGPTVRWSALKSLALLVEGDVIHRTPQGGQTQLGAATMLTADFEPVRGLHTMFTTEMYRAPIEDWGWSNREWLSAVWFAFPHVDLRVDGIWATEAIPDSHVNAVMLLGQAHLSL